MIAQGEDPLKGLKVKQKGKAKAEKLELLTPGGQFGKAKLKSVSPPPPSERSGKTPKPDLSLTIIPENPRSLSN